MTPDLNEKTELGDIYNLPGEGFVVELHQGADTFLYDRQGLQYLILEKKQRGVDASAEEAALLRINSFGPVFDGSHDG